MTRAFSCGKAPAHKRAAAQITVRRLSAPMASHLSLKVLPEQLIRCPHLLRQTLHGFLLQFRRHPVKGFGNAAGDAGKGVAVFSFTPDAASGSRLRFPLSTLRRRMPGRLPAASGRAVQGLRLFCCPYNHYNGVMLPFHGKASARQNRLLQAFNHWQEPVHFLKFRHPQTMQVAVGVDRRRTSRRSCG